VHITFEGGRLSGLELVPLALNDKGDEPERHLETRGRPRIARGADATRILERFRSLSKDFGTTLELRDDRGYLTLYTQPLDHSGGLDFRCRSNQSIVSAATCRRVSRAE
jgi:hypothetical protein